MHINEVHPWKVYIHLKMEKEFDTLPDVPFDANKSDWWLCRERFAWILQNSYCNSIDLHMCTISPAYVYVCDKQIYYNIQSNHCRYALFLP